MTDILLDELVVTRAASTKNSNPEPGLTRKVGAYNEKLFLVEHNMEKGWVGSAHSHPHDQVVYVISGHLRVQCAGKTFDVNAGDSFAVKGGAVHQASALEPSHVVDVFTPRRDDYM